MTRRGSLTRERAAKDAELIRILFPGKHRTFVVVTDLAWPHA